jgi:hypothetical protein
MDKNGQITISGDDFMKGMQNSPALGIHKMINIDASSKPGVLKIARKLKLGASTSSRVDKISNTLEGGVFVGEGNDVKTFNIVADAGVLGSAISGGPAALSKELVVFEGYLFKVYDSSPNIVLARCSNPLLSPSWTTSWATLGTGSGSTIRTPSFVGQDGLLYIGFRNTLTSLSDGNNSGTLNTNALDLSGSYNITGISEIGQFLILTARDAYNLTSADIIPWDRVSASFDIIHKVGGDGSYCPISFKGLAYFLVGFSGDLYATNLSQSELVKRFSLSTDFPSVGFDTLDADTRVPMTIHDQGILVALGKTSSTASENTTSGIFYLKDGILTQFVGSAGEGNVAGGIRYNHIVSISADTFIVSWEKGESPSITYGIDFLSTTTRATAYSAYIESALYTVGGIKTPKKFQQGELILAKELATGEGLKVSYRNNLNDTFTEIDTFEYGSATGADNDNLGAVSVINIPMESVPPCQTIQFKIAMTTGSASDTTPELLLAKFW